MVDRNWSICIDGDLPGAENMRRDDQLLSAWMNGGGSNVVRFYGWKPACLSYGNAQNPEREFELDELEKDGVELVKRPTGGRAVLHIDELTYSVCGEIRNDDWSSSLSKTYEEINRVLALGFRMAGFDLDLDRGEMTDVGFIKGGVAKPCFSSTSRSELVWNGRKVVGSAQRRNRCAFLQHGSIMVSPQAYEVVKYFKLPENEKIDFLKGVKNHAVCLEEIFKKKIDRDFLQDNLIKAFNEIWKI